MFKLKFDETEFEPALVLRFEHSLSSLSKWESIHTKPFYNKDGQTLEETFSYIEQMCLDDISPEQFLPRITNDHIKTVQEYLSHQGSATTFREDPNAPQSREIITAELIYYWMVMFKIPFTPADTWQLSRLMTLIKVCSVKQEKPRKMNPRAQAEEYRRLNEQRRQQLNTSG